MRLCEFGGMFRQRPGRISGGTEHERKQMWGKSAGKYGRRMRREIKMCAFPEGCRLFLTFAELLGEPLPFLLIFIQDP